MTETHPENIPPVTERNDMSGQTIEPGFGTTAVHASKHDEMSSVPIHMAATSRHFTPVAAIPLSMPLNKGWPNWKAVRVP